MQGRKVLTDEVAEQGRIAQVTQLHRWKAVVSIDLANTLELDMGWILAFARPRDRL